MALDVAAARAGTPAAAARCGRLVLMDIMLRKAEEKQTGRMAEAIARLHIPNKGPPASSDEQPCDS